MALQETAAWQALRTHQAALAAIDLRTLFADDPARAQRLTLAVGDLTVDFSKHLVTESTMVACPHADRVADGERVPGITQWGINDKPANVDLDSFYREWAVHSEISFDLHPYRDSYIRNAIVRKLTEATPHYLGIVLERFPSLDVFVDESRYFGDPAVTQKMFEHVPMFYDFETAITGGLSEYRWA